MLKTTNNYFIQKIESTKLHNQKIADIVDWSVGANAPLIYCSLCEVHKSRFSNDKWDNLGQSGGRQQQQQQQQQKL